MVKHLSPTALFLFESNKQEFYFKYMSTERPPKIPQLQVMSIGSSFDAYSKAYLIEKFGGTQYNDDKYKFPALFEAQVELQNRTWALDHGKHVFDSYREVGALSDLMLEMQNAGRVARFEFRVEGTIGEVPIIGYPDMAWKTDKGAHIIADWKVNGYLSRTKVSPAPGYIAYRGNSSKGRFNKYAHKQAVVMNEKGLAFNCATTLDTIDKKWATQLSTYAWLMGETVGGDFFGGLEQICCEQDPFGGRPFIAVASFRNKISKDFQQGLYNRYLDCWRACNDGHFFKDLSLEESKARCSQMDGMAKSLQPSGDAKQDWFSKSCR